MSAAGRNVGSPAPSAVARAPASEPALGFGSVLLFWMSLTVLIEGGLWLTGFRNRELTLAVGQGAARAEADRVGEVGDEVIRKAVRTQRETLPFWGVLAFLGDFLVEPAALGVRALGVATAFSASAALMGRPIGYDRGLLACAGMQGFWVLGLAVRAALMMALGRTEVETSAALFLPAGTVWAPVALGLGQLDAFALAGWVALGWGGVRRGQVGMLSALVVCGSAWVFEASIRVAFELLIGSAMRLALVAG